MEIYHLTIELLDALYYAREGLAGAVTPPVVHATALNCALATAMNVDPELHPFVMTEANGGQNTPRYSDSRVSNSFYATPAGMLRSPNYSIQIAKGENDGFLQIHQRAPNESLGVRRIDVRNQPLRYRELHFLTPETQFGGFLILCDESLILPERIRLGSFRSPARVRWAKATSWRRLEKPAIADHPIDPLVSNVTRGVMLNMLPYGIVEGATTSDGVSVRFSTPPLQSLGDPRKQLVVAWPEGYALDEAQRVRSHKGMAIL